MESIVFVCVENYLKNLKNKSFRKTQLKYFIGKKKTLKVI